MLLNCDAKIGPANASEARRLCRPVGFGRCSRRAERLRRRRHAHEQLCSETDQAHLFEATDADLAAAPKAPILKSQRTPKDFRNRRSRRTAG
jgi:hypothetical protein